MIDTLKKYETVSFAMEGVLTDELDGTTNPMKEEMQKLCKDLVKMGKRVIIYTKRYERSDNKHLSIDNKKEYKPGYDTASNLGVQDIIFTNRTPFYHYMNNDSYQCHINCSGYESVLIKRYKPHVNIININQEMWLQKS